MKLYLMLLFTLLCTPAYGQFSVSVAPVSHQAWGRAENVHMTEISYDGLGLHYFLQYGEAPDPVQPPLLMTYSKRYSHNAAISYRYRVFDFLRVGIISFIDQFPEPDASRINLWIDAGVDIWRFRLSYVHISNAFMAPVNTGYDAISLSFNLTRKQQ